MPKIMTAKTRSLIFFLPYSRDKSEGIWCRPLTLTKRMELQREALQEAGMDTDLSEHYLCKLILKASITDWKGFWSPTGEEIPFSHEAVDDLCENDPAMAVGILSRILGLARVGELDERKNS